MKRGRQTCRILKEIRRQIAKANNIEYLTSECRYQGDCRGTCPRCEAEVNWLEEQLRRRSAAGKLIRVAGISAGILALAGCSGPKTPPDALRTPADTAPEITADTTPIPIQPDSADGGGQQPLPELAILDAVVGEVLPEDIPEPPKSGEILLPDAIIESDLKAQGEIDPEEPTIPDPSPADTDTNQALL